MSRDMNASIRAREVFELQLERAHLRAMRAVSLRGTPLDPDPDPSMSDAIDAEVAGIEEALQRVSGSDDQLPMNELVARFSLTGDEADFLWTAVAMAAEPRMITHAQALVGSEARRGLSMSLYSVLANLAGDQSRALALQLNPAHPLLRFRLLDTIEEGYSHSAAALTVSSRLVSYLSGGDEVDELLVSSGGRVEPPEEPLFDERQEKALRRVAEGLSAREAVVIVIEGPFGSGRRTAAAVLAAQAGAEVLSVDVKRIAPTVQSLEAALVALRRDCLLRGALPLIAEAEDLSSTREDGGARMRTLARMLDSTPGPVVVTSTRPGLELTTQRPLLRVDWPVPDFTARRKLWSHFLDAESEALADGLDEIALRYRLGAGGIERAADAARLIRHSRGDDVGLEIGDLIEGVRNNIAEHLGELAKRIEVTQSWDDLVLSQDLLDQVHALIARVRHAHTVYEDWKFNSKAARGIGVPVLFSGPPGTGKTMVAGIIAKDLDLELLQVDMSQVVSKWVGETEKQLSKVFDAAEAGHALLLFDEADALFSKRTTDVKGATDRYANLEVSYLLQRIESFGGITILTTNLDAAIDRALRRRLASHIVFWPPDEEERIELWGRLLATGAAPIEGELAFEDLSRTYPDMTGANIRNAVLAAAFLAASEGADITQDHLDRAAKGEYRTMGRIMR
ncbi:MAG: ATP-binding protein [Deltaproteobacteria bacterium]|nr:ATP-binding protein [Deltaproteobacteria bacterium]